MKEFDRMVAKYNVDNVYLSLAEIPCVESDFEDSKNVSTSNRSDTSTTGTPVASNLNYDIPQFNFDLKFASQTSEELSNY